MKRFAAICLTIISAASIAVPVQAQCPRIEPVGRHTQEGDMARRSLWNLLLLLILLGLSGSAFAGTVTWINTTGGDWHTASNWDTGSPPGPDDDVVIDAAGTRLRPILMTTAATVMGHLPLIFASGP
ncbi:MAG: efflux RND transporter permease subunit, partial [Acidobacteria bacterium]|nr:efflux RND transporter permease subunit [Acidobacteriota bacterium]